MVKDCKTPKTRRRFIQSTATGLLTTSLLTGTTGASESRQTGRSKAGGRSPTERVTIEDGEVIYSGPKQKIPRGQAKKSTADFSPSELDGYMQTGVEGLNEAASDGYIEFEEKEDEIWAVPTEKGRSEYGSDGGVGILCGKNDYRSSFTVRGGYRYSFYLNDGYTRDLASLMASGATAGAIVALITKATGVGIPIGIVAAVAGLLAALGWNLITSNNNGCGIRIRYYPLAPPVPGLGITFKPQ